ncbi:MAG: hypothetical protein ACE37H_00035 [Phycisphaeraceae bacterium]
MKRFPVEKRRPQIATLSGTADHASIRIPLAPFDLDDQSIETVLVLEQIRLPTVDRSRLCGRSFDFPSNPQAGYIDGSIYIDHAHHPVDVSSIHFHSNRVQHITVEI